MASIMTGPITDNAFLGPLKGGSLEPTFGGALSFMRRRYSRDLDGVDAVVWGIPFDQATTNRPGARFGPQAIRRASAIFDGDPQYPFRADPFATLATIDYGDAAFDYSRPMEFADAIEAQAGAIIAGGAQLFSLGGDHFITYPLLKAHVAKYGPLALVQFDAHQDTWPDHPASISHGTFVGRAVREGLIDVSQSIQVGIAARIRERVGDTSAYLTFDIDCLDPAYAPGTGTPVAGGLSSREALTILRGLGPLDFVGGDVVEVAPAYDHADVTAIAAATVAMYYLGLLAERRRG
jgi:agmatinase